MGTAKAIRDGYGEALLELGRDDRNVVVLDADLAESTRSSVFRDAYPDRFFNAGIAEQNMINMAVGLALSGKTVFASSFAIFATGRCWEQLRNSVAATRANVKVVASHGGLTVGPDGLSHQCVEDISLMRTIPHFAVIVPCDWLEAKKAVLAAARMKGPVYIRTARPKTAQVTAEETPFAIGKSVRLRPGDDVTIIACGVMVEAALEAAGDLASGGIAAGVIDMHTIKPLDAQAVMAAAIVSRSRSSPMAWALVDLTVSATTARPPVDSARPTMTRHENRSGDSKCWPMPMVAPMNQKTSASSISSLHVVRL